VRLRPDLDSVSSARHGSAHLAYLRMDTAAIAHHAGEALRLAAPGGSSAQSRANLVVAQALDEAGRFDLAKPWYDRATPPRDDRRR
jgi:hypothetical protein